MPSVNVNGLDIAYENHGNEDAPTILMIQGLSMPLVGWPPSMISAFTAAGFRVITFDNRDIGKSTVLNHLKTPSPVSIAIRSLLRMKVKSPYLLTDMAQDAVCLLDALGVDKSHIIGISMGGMIAQTLAIHHSNRVLSLTSIMSHTGNSKVIKIDRAVRKQMMKRPKNPTHEERLAYTIKTWELIGSPAYPMTEEDRRTFVESIIERGSTAMGVMRQMLAIMGSPNRVSALKKLDVPTLVLHGDQDPLVHLDGGKDTAASIPGAKIKIYPGMGHDLPEALLDDMCEEIITHAQATV